MRKDSKIYVAGHTGMVGSAFVRALRRRGYGNLVLCAHEQLDLTRQADVEAFFAAEKPEYVIDAAALVGGIQANSTAPADFFHVNQTIQENLIWTAYKSGVKKLLFLGSACMYPRDCSQPMKEEYLLTGLPEYTNEGYALAKCCGSRLCSYLRRQYGADFITAIPANAYGPGDSFDPEHSHVIPALIRKCHEAKARGARSIGMWGTGSALREFIHTDDIASAGLFLMEHYSDERPINVGTGEEFSMLELAKMICEVTGFTGGIALDPSKPDGMPRRLCDSTRLRGMGWKAEIDIKKGLALMYEDFQAATR